MRSAVIGGAGWSGTRELASHFRFSDGDDGELDLFVRETTSDSYQVTLGEEVHQLHWLEQTADSARISIDDVQQTVRYALLDRGEVAVQWRGSAAVLTNQLAFTKGDESVGGSGTILAPMHGNVIAIAVAVGDRVEAGQDVAVMEAMKMEHRLSAQVAGEVTAVHVSEGDQVATGTVVLEIASED